MQESATKNRLASVPRFPTSVSQGLKTFFMSRQTSFYGRRTTCSVRENKVCPLGKGKREGRGWERERKTIVALDF